MRLRTSGPAIGLVLALGTAAGCGSEDIFTPELGSKERAISREAVARIASRDEGLVQALVVGDLDGDGIDDALIRTDFGYVAPNGKQGLGGSVYILYGGSSPKGQIDLATLPVLTHTGSSGGGVEAVGDVDGDGLADFLVGIEFTPGCGLASQWETDFTNGGAFLVYGSKTRLAGSHSLADVGAFLRDATPCTFADATASLGDIDGDGKADFAIGRSTQNESDPPELLVFYGRSERLTGTLDLRATADASFRGTGAGLTFPAAIRVGDVDGDGLSDFLLKMPMRTVTADLHLVRGSATRLAGAMTPADLGPPEFPAFEGCAWSAMPLGAALGDLDGDGADDFSLVSCHEDIPNGMTTAVVHRVFYGRTGGLPAQLSAADAAATITTAVLEDHLAGQTVRITAKSQLIAGDVDGDGRRDLILADETLHDLNGGVHVIAGRAERLSGTIDPVAVSFLTYVGQPAREADCHGGDDECIVTEGVGSGWISVGDLTGDHRADLLVGATANGGIPTQGLALSDPHTYVLSPPARPKP